MVHRLRLLLVSGCLMSGTFANRVIWFAVSLVAACSGSSDDRTETYQASPASEREPSDDATQGSFGSAACDECLANGCAGEMEACTTVPRCASFLDCIIGCAGEPDAEECFNGCAMTGEPPDELLPFFQCLDTQCLDQCAMPQDTPG
jgi:hypothetical protein